ncbi:MAG TPA: hypothetical protein VGO90_12330 [Chthoniobacteraceae bacterium]|jgi:hypothetical protein|nr:hypothetical protein [Chthoniobacteraceae bacterium]
MRFLPSSLLLLLSITAFGAEPLQLARDGHWLIIRNPQTPGTEIRVNYLEAYCRAGSSDADWVKQTVILHTSRQLPSEQPGVLRQVDTLADGVIVEHAISATVDEVTFQVTARNPTSQRSDAHWAQSCVRLGAFTGFESTSPDLDDYLPKCFIFLDGKLTRMPAKPWATQARYTPGQVWGAPGVPRDDLNPRPISTLQPSNGLIGCFSADETQIFATAWEPYQELFQGVARCLHSDFRLGGLSPGGTREVRGKIYLVSNDVPALLARYSRDFPEHRPDRIRK